jgi:hypothetical protein
MKTPIAIALLAVAAVLSGCIAYETPYGERGYRDDRGGDRGDRDRGERNRGGEGERRGGEGGERR